MEDITIIPMPPRTMMEVFTILPEGTLAQLIENNLVLRPTPPDRHQAVLGELLATLYRFIKSANLGELRAGPYDVYLDQQNAFQPDICFISKERTHLIQETGLFGSPDLVIEILDKANSRYDLFDKKDVYERCGVKELWLIDPADKSATGYWLTGDEYQEFFKGISKIEFKLFDFGIEF